MDWPLLCNFCPVAGLVPAAVMHRRYWIKEGVGRFRVKDSVGETPKDTTGMVPQESRMVGVKRQTPEREMWSFELAWKNCVIWLDWTRSDPIGLMLVERTLQKLGITPKSRTDYATDSGIEGTRATIPELAGGAIAASNHG
jgi:hypothetical protein